MNQMPQPLSLAAPPAGGLPRPGGPGSGVENTNQNQRKPKPNNPKKAGTTCDKKAHAKIKDAKALITDAKMWGHKIDEEAVKEPTDSTVFLS